MKRGLKVDNIIAIGCSQSRYNHCPDEKGTERRWMRLETPSDISYNHCPDEKGTESTTEVRAFKVEAQVTTIAPMKRGLKAH